MKGRWGGATFDFRSNTIRVVQIDGEPWFTLADIRRALGRSRGGKQTSFLSDDERRKVRELNGATLKGHGLTLISESGLYKLVMRSDKPQARAFQDWVTRDVLPPLPLPPEPA